MAPLKRKRGRPRDPGADRRILDAARLVAAEVGIRGASMSAIADRSGVGKPTIYLRWANRAELMIAAVADLRVPVPVEHTGSIRNDLHRSLTEDHELYVTGEHGPFLRSVLFESVHEDGLAREFEASILGPRRERLSAIVSRGVEGGQIRPGIDPDLFANALSCPLERAMVMGGEGLDARAIEGYVDLLLLGAGERFSDAMEISR